MRNLYLGFLFSLLFIPSQDIMAQEEGNYWMFGLGYNFVDDSGSRWSEFIDFDDHWATTAYPNRLSAGYYLQNGLGFELIGSINKYNEGLIVDGEEILEERDYRAIDLKISYDLNHLIGSTGWFDPYVATGIGNTSIEDVARTTFNAGLGFNAWFSDSWGLNFNTFGKWSLNSDINSNHLQHSAGVVFRFGQGLKKNKSTPGSIPAVVQNNPSPEPQQEEVVEDVEPELPEEPAEEVVPAAPVKSEEELRAEEMRRKLNMIETVYYRFDSSYLTEEDKKVVENLESFMEEFPEAKLEIHAHADQRGDTAYNKWLSEKRANRIVEYLTERGINSSRLKAIGHGESDLINDCGDANPCSREEHRQNRRTEYILFE
ncbi:OmpA family protein [Robertkochia aurantiaca]|uniref:OmpA family protein n=1 Tax=Robertkochia aurantiaca TaxID=2873700 RepID=UPI001CCE7752|nr:OmpA family protein [Robertkochia sp. 3YJGBD-33]